MYYQVSLDYEDDGRSMSSETRAVVEEEVRQLIQSAYTRARSILTAHEPELHALASELLERETLSGDQIKEMIRNMVKGAEGVMQSVQKSAEGVVATARKGATAAAGAAQKAGRPGIA